MSDAPAFPVNDEPTGSGVAASFVVVAGLSGAGRSTAADALEDLGWTVVENLPAELAISLVEQVVIRDQGRLAVTIDSRDDARTRSLIHAVGSIRDRGVVPHVLFLDASDDVLIRRFEGARRPHPLQGQEGVVEGIERERALLGELRGEADLVVDTSLLNPHQLGGRVAAAFGHPDDLALRATVMSFGFKYGVPIDADLVADVRFLPNPHWVPELRPLTGLDPRVSDHVVESDLARRFLDRYSELLDLVADGYLREGKRYVTIAVGCTGGKHRSVAMAEHLAARLVKVGVDALVVHRDLGRE
jgi:RNase adapter protein RapZ